MKLDFAFFSESMLLHQDGLFSVLGAGIEWIVANRFPAVKPNLVLTARLSFEPQECGKTYRCVVKASAPDGTPIIPDLSIEFDMPSRIRSPELGNTFMLRYVYDRFMFKMVGFHQFSFSIDDVSLGSVKIEAAEEELK